MRILLFVFLFFTYQVVVGQRQNLKVEQLTTKEGLSQSNVMCIFQDSRGFMWFGTRDGLNKYDGYKFTVYKNIVGNNNSIINNTISDIVEDLDGNLWIGTYGGLSKFDREKERFINYRNNKDDPSSISSNVINTLLKDREGNIWVGVERTGFDMYDKRCNSFIHYNYDPEDSTTIIDFSVKKLYQDKNDNIWLGTGECGLKVFNPKDKFIKRFRNNKKDAKSISYGNIWSILEDSKGRIWIGTREGGVNLYNPQNESFTHYLNNPLDKNSISNNVILAIIEDEKGHIWMGTENGGISVLDPERGIFQNYKNDPASPSSLNSNSIYSLFRDNKGNIWIGTFSGGVNLINPDADKFAHYRSESSEYGLSHNNVLSLAENSKGELLIGTDGGGLNILDHTTGTFKHYIHKEGDQNSLSGDNVLSAIEDRKGNIWVGMWAQGISVFHPRKNKYKHYKRRNEDPHALSSNNAWIILEDSDGNIWIGTYSAGLELFDPINDNFIHHLHDPNNPKSISNNTVNALFEDSKKVLWVGTNGNGISKYDKHTKSFKSYLPGVSVNSLSEDYLGNLYIGTNAGLKYFDVKTEEVISYHAIDGLPNEMIFGIIEDRKKNIWISTNNGISKFNPSNKQFKNYGIESGLQSSEFRKAFLKSKSGLLYFGGINGFNVFDPDRIKEIPFEPKMVITEFQIFNSKVPISVSGQESPLIKDITETKELTLSYKHSVITLEFASLNYTSSDKKKYSYMLEGFDKNWNNIGTKHAVTYTNLDPGEYTFKVKGLDNEGNWSNKITRLNITITPPFWKTWWFKGFICLAGIACFTSFYMIRISVIKAQKKQLEDQVIERTSQLETQKEKLEKVYYEIKDSIRAAEVIQHSLLPDIEKIKENLPESFILNRPKDVVSGDFYWFDTKEDKIIVAAVDCTGHGVSGAFMAINAHHLLNLAIYPFSDLKASEILNRLNESLLQEHSNNNDDQPGFGMDIAICILDKGKKNLQYAGANSPMYLVRNGELIQFKPNRISIGQYVDNEVKKFTNHEITLEDKDAIYLFSDGFVDQIGGPSGDQKFMYPNFRNLLLALERTPMNDQLVLLEKKLIEWKGNVEQLDDILVIGFKV